MSKREIIEKIMAEKIVVIIRSAQSEGIAETIAAVRSGGLQVIEVTYNTPDCLELVRDLREQYPDLLLGVGTVTNGEAAEKAIKAGARYLVTPITSEEIMTVAKKHEVPVIMGAFTPTEIYQAHAAGADFVKLFPADHLGLSFLKAVRSTMRDILFLPTGGITLDNIESWLEAGVAGLGIGSALVHQKDISTKDFQAITEKAKAFRAKVGTM